jgi:aryl-alcohol dehydrogenase-like predicted oxidoreductase
VGRYEPNFEKMFDFSAAKTIESVDQSLQLLGLDYVDVIQVHDIEFADDINQVILETLPALEKVRQQGKAR